MNKISFYTNKLVAILILCILAISISVIGLAATKKTGTKLSLKVSDTSIISGQRVKLSGKLKQGKKALARKKVKIKAGRKVVKTVRTNQRGSFSYNVKPAKTTTYKAIFSGSKTLKASSSKSVTIRVSRGKALKTLAEQRGILFGAFYQWDLRGGKYNQIFAREMNAMTAGTFMLDGGISHKSRYEFDFSEMDDKVNWGRARNIEVHGHVLVWFDDIADWLNATPNSEVEAVMNERIDAFVKRYAGKIKVWDVVNEAVSDDDGTLRQDHKWAEAMGNDYIAKAFVRAHAADPTAVLRYNEYDLESNTAKFEGVKDLLTNLKNQGVPVHALGWQLHLKPSSFDAATLLKRMKEIADLGFDNYITELDVELPAKAKATNYEQQKQTYKTIVKTFLAARRYKTIVVWGLRDGDPWWLKKNHPLLFDEHFNKKPAYFGVQEALE